MHDEHEERLREWMCEEPTRPERINTHEVVDFWRRQWSGGHLSTALVRRQG